MFTNIMITLTVTFGRSSCCTAECLSTSPQDLSCTLHVLYFPAPATYHWPSSWRFAALWGFIQPVVDAARHACLHHSCFLFEKGQKSVKHGCHRQQVHAGSASELGSFLPLSLSLCSHTHTQHVSLTLSYPSPSCIFTLNVLPPLPGEANTLPFSHMLLMFRMLSVTMGRSTAPERGDRDSLFSLCWDKKHEWLFKRQQQIPTALLLCTEQHN